MKRTLTVVSITAIAATLLLVGGLRVAHGQTDTKSAKQAQKFPAMTKATTILQQAIAELQNTNNNFGPHRSAAIEACDRTLVQLKIALRYEQDPSNQAGRQP
jgi:hypothetical protein